MPLVSIRLSDDVEALLAEEAEQRQRSKSEIVREAIMDHLARQARERFLADIARAARVRGDAEALALADEALAFDNEALDLLEASGIGEPRASYGARKRKPR